MSPEFVDSYRILGIAQEADWPAVRLAYKRLVNRWHPDRYMSRPRERLHAQNKFIEFTRAYDSLRHYYRRNGRLPGQTAVPHANVSDTASTGPAAPAPSATNNGHQNGDRKSANGQGNGLGNGPDSTPAYPSNRVSIRRRRRPWVLPLLALMIGTLGGAFWLDRQAQLSAAAAARAAKASHDDRQDEFQPSAREIRRQMNRGVFIEREDSGKLGDQLIEDAFR